MTAKKPYSIKHDKLRLCAVILRYGNRGRKVALVVPPNELERLLPGLERVGFRSSHIVFGAGDPARYVYFPQEALISLLANMDDGRSAEVNLTGKGGIVGISEVPGAATHRYTAAVVVRDPVCARGWRSSTLNLHGARACSSAC